ncbi:MAG: hypothetical protein H7123_06100, partial [Thermoleophilia bacterium]|nr:hypothetical protein [Thermoleophilia bacterium]
MSVALATWREHAMRPLRLTLVAILIAATVLTASALVGGVARADAASAPALSLSRPTITSFVADWDGEEDSTRITVNTRVNVRIAVEIQTPKGVVIRSLYRGQLRGARDVFWDGRANNGAVAAAGSYRFIARRIGMRTRDAALSVNAPAVRPVALVEPNLSIASLSLTRGLLSSVAGRDRTVIKYRLTTPGSVSAAIAAPNGDIVRQLFVGRSKVGTSALVWDGRSNSGVMLADGSYELLVAASSGGHMPTNTQSAPVRIDTQAPTVATAARLQARLAKGRITVPFSLTAGEGGIVKIIGTGGHRVVTTTLVGAHNLSLSGASLGLVARSRAVTSTV